MGRPRYGREQGMMEAFETLPEQGYFLGEGGAEAPFERQQQMYGIRDDARREAMEQARR
jgi:hypothetical protein